MNNRLLVWLQQKERLLWLEYSVLALCILLPLLLPGYILTLDLVFTPHFSWPGEVTNTYLLEGLLWLLHFILPGDMIEKIILFLILLISGVGAHLLMRLFKPAVVRSEFWKPAMYFAGLLYMINPFTYSRFMAGQWMVLLGYAFLPFFIKALCEMLYTPSLKTMLRVLFFALGISIVSLHHIGILFCVGLLVAIGGSIKCRHSWPHLRRFLGWSAAMIFLFFIASLYWIVPALGGQGKIGSSLASFNQAHFEAFKTNGSGALGPLGEVVRMQGFWAEAQELFVLPQSIVPMWGVVVLLLWVLVVVGIKKAWPHNKLIVGLGVGSIFIGTILAATPFIDWLKDMFPLAAGYREPHKFANLIVLGYGILGTFGVGYLLEAVAKRFSAGAVKVTCLLCLVLPFVITPTMLWGFSGQLTPKAYPQEWFHMNTLLKNKKDMGQVLFLPWHEYANYSFSGRLIANPAEKFFEVPVVASDDPEFRGAPPTRPDRQKKEIATLLKTQKAFSNTLTRLGIHYVLLAKEQDFAAYKYLDGTSGIRVVSEDAKFKLYKVETR